VAEIVDPNITRVLYSVKMPLLSGSIMEMTANLIGLMGGGRGVLAA
jgi:hypothetical protein